VQIVIEEELLREADAAAKKANVNRSALMRQALREHLKRQRRREMEEQERIGYEKFPDTGEDLPWLENVAAWPEQ